MTVAPTDALELLVELTGIADAGAALLDAGFWSSCGVALRGLLALVLIACIGLFCLRCVRVLLPSAGLPLRWSSTVCLGMWTVTVAFHVLRSIGLFHPLAALVGCGGLAALTLRAFPQRAPIGWVLARERRAARLLWRRMLHGRHAVINAIFLGFGALYALRALVIPPLGWDTLTYHGPRAAMWVQSGQFTFEPGPSSFSLYRNFFGGGEVLLAWAMLPLHSDLLVNLAQVVQWLGLFFAVWALARAIGLREPFAACGAGVAAFLPTLQFELNSGYVEIALNASLMHGIALAMHGLRRPSGPVVVLAAMSLGTAAGIKLLGAPAGLLMLCVLGLRVLWLREVAPRRRFAWLGLGAFCALIPVLPWVLFAWADTGYPLSPMPVELFGVQLGVADPALHWYQMRPGLTAYDWQAETKALLAVFAPLGPPRNEALGSLAIIPFLVAPFGAVSLVRRRPLLGGLLSLVALVPLLTHFSRAMTPVRVLWAVSSSRFLLTALILATLLSLAWCRPKGLASTLYRRVLLAYPLTYSVLYLRWGWGPWEIRELVITGVVIALAATLIAHLFSRSWRSGVAALAGGFALVCALLQLRADTNRPLAFRESFALHTFLRFWTEAVPLVDEPDTPHRIAVTGGQFQAADRWFTYAFFGRRFQNEIHYVPPTRDGRIAHYGPGGRLEAKADPAAWEAGLTEAGIDLVLSFVPRSLEQGWMEAAPERFTKLAGNRDWGLFRHKKTSGQQAAAAPRSRREDTPQP